MANTIKIKNSGTTSNVPSSLEHGELAINYADGLLFYKNSSNVISQFSSGGGASVTISDTAPSSPSAGDLWYESDAGDFFVYYDSYWVELGADPPSSSFLSDLDGDTLIQVEESNDEDKIRFDTAGSERMIIDNTGKVGIGTTAPDYPLDVNGKVIVGGGDNQTPDALGNGHLMIDGNGYTGFASLDGTAMWVGHNSGSRSLYLATDETARVTVTGGGLVGIGTTSPVTDTVNIGDGSNNGSFRVHANQGAESFRVAGDVVRSSSIVNLTTASAANVFVNTANNSMYRSTSSGKYKTDIETLDVEHADKIFDLRPVWYRSTTGNDPAEYSYYGLIAEEVAVVDPRLVHFGAVADCECVEDEEGHIEHEQSCLTEPEGVFYERFVPHLISVVQRQRAEINALTSRIETLEAG